MKILQRYCRFNPKWQPKKLVFEKAFEDSLQQTLRGKKTTLSKLLKFIKPKLRSNCFLRTFIFKIIPYLNYLHHLEDCAKFHENPLRYIQ